MEHPDFLIIIWICIVTAIWRYIRKKKPGLLGLGNDPNKQKLDGAKYTGCPKCEWGVLEPVFRWWQYTLLISTPIGFILFGKPIRYQCNKCSFQKHGSTKRIPLTRLSLSHRLTKPFCIGISVNIVLGLIIGLIFLNCVIK
ncbi:hypothetical protein [Desulfogranum marinum]|uniref:hypothetical protein n=1 Tax=Desulfogranum marinum TaxID=453220 RepID=UPI0029C8055A|nr:hypothetical protein [Desulfogranum marinum]